VLAEAHATSPFLGYQPTPAQSPFPAVICASVNDAALHDIPGGYRLADGDLLSIDCGATLDGWAADAAISVQAGHQHPADTRLIATATQALRAGIAAAVPGGRQGDISAGIGAVGRAAGYGICTDFGGHGIAGGTDACKVDSNGWTIRSTDGSRAAHVEHPSPSPATGQLSSPRPPDQASGPPSRTRLPRARQVLGADVPESSGKPPTWLKLNGKRLARLCRPT
jgi:methionyl aminopeptidase